MSDFYGNGENLPTLHPDVETNKNILIGELCTKLDTARQALARAMGLNVVSSAGLATKGHIRWALNETHPGTLVEQHPNCG
jgi:hypothetical protein